MSQPRPSLWPRTIWLSSYGESVSLRLGMGWIHRLRYVDALIPAEYNASASCPRRSRELLRVRLVHMVLGLTTGAAGHVDIGEILQRHVPLARDLARADVHGLEDADAEQEDEGADGAGVSSRHCEEGLREVVERDRSGLTPCRRRYR